MFFFFLKIVFDIKRHEIPHQKKCFIGEHIYAYYIRNAVFFVNFHYEVFQVFLNGGTKNKAVGTEQMD